MANQEKQTGIFFISKFIIPRQNETSRLRNEMKTRLEEKNILPNHNVRYYTGNTAFPAEAITNDEITIYYGIVNDKKELVMIVTLEKNKLKKLLKDKVDKRRKGDRLTPPKDLGPLIVGGPVWDKENDKQGAK